MVYAYNGILFSVKRDTVLVHATTWMSPGDILCEISQTQKHKYSMVLPK
jgi:hypothetical protein